MQQGIITKSRSKPRNILRGIIPTASGFDTPPSNLERCTDGNLSLGTGAGTKAIEGAGTVGELVFDAGSVKTLLLGGRVGLSQNASATIRVLIDSSDDNITWRTSTSILYSTNSGSERKESLLAMISTGRYFKVRLYSTAACTASIIIYQIVGYELGV
jgi:hypothetical protein